MWNKKLTALLLCAALALGGVTALAAGEADPPAPQEAAQGQSQEDAAQKDASEEAQEPQEDAQELQEDAQEEIVPDPLGTVSFANLDSRLRENNLSMLALEENIAALEVIDYDKMREQMKDSLNAIAKQQWALQMSSSMFPDLSPGEEAAISMSASLAEQSLQQAYDSLRDTFEDLKDGKLQEDNEALIRQLRNAQDQVVMAAQSLYVALVGLEHNDDALDRTLAALDRTVEELELRYDLGQVSALTLQQTKAGRTTAVSGKQTLEMNITNYKTQLELMVGAELSGAIALQPLPQVTAEELEEMDLEADLAQAKEVSYQLFAAQRTLEDAKESAKESAKGYMEKTYQYKAAQHQRQAAEYTYASTVQSFELSFRTLYNQVKDCWQVLTAAQTALACQQDTYASMELKYEQGSLSHNKLLDAADELASAQDTVDSARLDLFSVYNNYRWAVDYGILN